ncbi:MAG: DUF222 domain-containing protein [Actinomycetes bacterium]
MTQGSGRRNLVRTWKALVSIAPGTTAPALSALAAVRDLARDETRERLREATSEERAEWLIALQRLSDAAAAATLLAIDVFDAKGDAEILRGAQTTQSWIRAECRTSATEADQRVRLARASRTSSLSDAVVKLVDGSLTAEHLRVIDRSTRRLAGAERDDAIQLLTTLAECESVSLVRSAGRHLAQVIDPDGTLAALQHQFDRRYLTLAPMMDGMTSLDGLLDAESAAVVDAALRPFLTPEGPTDVRTNAQRRADGLVQVLATACDAQLIPQAGSERPHLHVVVGGDGPAHLAPRREALHLTSVARIVCDAHITPLLLDAQGTVVDLGRTRRLFSTQQRKLLAARDGGCRWPGCHRPPAHTDAHHVKPWHDGGVTDVSNAVLLCRHHHRLVHEGGWRITVDDQNRGTHGAVGVTGPHGRTFTSHPRGP